jgi:hypothetical protein
MESIEDMWKRFNLSEKEGLDVDLANTTQQSENILVAKFLTPRVLNIDSVARTFKPLWKTKRSFSVQDLGQNRAALIFDDEMDLERVLANEPWSFDKFLVVFQRFGDDIAIDDLTFSHASFWVQIHNIPVRRMTEESAGAIGRTLGQVERVADRDDERGGENCIRVRVRMDITTPLCRGRILSMEEGKKRWAAFRYERLPNFCYRCGHVDHAEKDCEEGLRQRNSKTPEEFQYGAWLRAEMDRPPRKTVVVVSGIQPRARPKSAWGSQSGKATPAPSRPSSPTKETEQVPEYVHENNVLDMEIEENPIFPKMVSSEKSNAEIFADQLREIDEAICYGPNLATPKSINPNMVNPACETPYSDTLVTPKSPVPLEGLRGVLNDITNGPPRTTSSPKTRTAKWKKLARAQSTKPVNADPSCHQKRSPLMLDPYTIKEKKKKFEQADSGDGTFLLTEMVMQSNVEEISAEAGLQLCRQP